MPKENSYVFSFKFPKRFCECTYGVFPLLSNRLYQRNSSKAYFQNPQHHIQFNVLNFQLQNNCANVSQILVLNSKISNNVPVSITGHLTTLSKLTFRISPNLWDVMA